MSPRGLLACPTFPPLCRLRTEVRTAAELCRQPTPGGRRGGDSEVTKCLQAARPSSAEEAPGLGLREAHAVVHQFERRLRRAPRLLRTEREKPLKLALIRTKGLEAFADRRQKLD